MKSHVPGWLLRLARNVEQLAASGKLTGGVDLVRRQQQGLRELRADLAARDARHVSFPAWLGWWDSTPDKTRLFDSRPYLEETCQFEILERIRPDPTTRHLDQYICVLADGWETEVDYKHGVIDVYFDSMLAFVVHIYPDREHIIPVREPLSAKECE